MLRYLAAALIATLPAMPLAADEPYRIAVVDPIRIVDQIPQYEAAGTTLELEMGDREAAILSQRDQLDALQNRLKSGAKIMSDDELQRLQNDIRARSRRLRLVEAEFREDFTLRKNELREKLTHQVQEVVVELAHELGIDLIISDGLVYHSKRLDISDQVIARLKERYAASHRTAE